MKKVLFCIGLAVLFFSVALQGFAQDRVAVSVEASSLGPGAKVDIKAMDKLNVRLGGNGFSYNFSGKAQDVDYKVKLHLMSFCLLADWFPFEQHDWRFTGGAILNKNRVNVDAKPAVSYKVGDTTYTSAQVGSLAGKITFEPVAPYLGLGWGNPFGKDSHWSFNFDLGAMYQGAPKVNLDANGPIANDPTFQSNLAQEKDQLKDKTNRFKFYPVVAIAVAYRF